MNRQPSFRERPPRIVVVGDLILDRYTWGDAERISPEAPVPVLRADLEEVRPGGAASVASLLRGLEAEVQLFGVLGGDSEGAALRRILEEQSIDLVGLVERPDRLTTSKHRFVGRAAGRHPHQILRVDREDRTAINSLLEEKLLAVWPAALAWADAVLISDYAKGVCTPSLLRRLIEPARAACVPVLVDPGRGCDPQGYRGATLLKPNRQEAELFAGTALETPEQAVTAAVAIRAQTGVESVVITLDHDGMAYASAEGADVAATRGRSAYDITGAGDMVLAVLGYGAACGWGLNECLRLANLAAGLEIERFGIEPVSWREIHAADSQASSRRSANKIVTDQEAARIAAAARRSGRRVVFTNGCFDLLHVGHVQTLEQAASLGDLLIVAVNSDDSVRRLKGSDRPIVSAQPRALMLAALSCVDHVLIFDEDTPHQLLEALRPDVLVKGGTTEEIVGGEIVDAHGGRVVRLPTELDLSTTQLIEKSRRTNRGLSGLLVEDGNVC